MKKSGPRPKRSQGIWYVSFEPKEWLPGQRAFIRKTETFKNEQDAKAFAKAKLTDGSNINAARSIRINRSGLSRQ